MPVDGERVINPAMHHINIKTTKLQKMIDWYGLVLGAKVNFQNPIVAFISNDRANHRIALLAVSGLRRPTRSPRARTMHWQRENPRPQAGA